MAGDAEVERALPRKMVWASRLAARRASRAEMRSLAMGWTGPKPAGGKFNHVRKKRIPLMMKRVGLSCAQRVLMAGLSAWLFCLCLPALASAESKITIMPMITADVEYHDNWDRTEETEREVFVYVVKPGFQFGVETPKTRINMSYTLEAHWYDDNESVPEGMDPASDDDYIGHLFVLDARYKPTRRITVGLNDDFYLTRDPRQSDIFDDRVDRRKYIVNHLTPLFFYDFENRFSLGIRYRRTDIHYLERPKNDLVEHRWMFNLLYNPTRTSTFDLDYQHWTVDYDESNTSDYSADQVRLLYEKRHRHFAFDVGAGYQWRDYDEPSIDDETTFTYLASILWQNPPPPEGRRYLGRQFVRARTHAFFGVEGNFNNYGDTYDATRFVLSLGHVFREKIDCRMRGWYQIGDYENYRGLTSSGELKDREDKTYDVYASVGYLITRKMEISLRVGRDERDSNIDGLSYVDNYCMLRFSFNFDILSRGMFSEEGAYY